MQGSSSLRDFTVIERLGEGSFACVYKVQRNDDKMLYAMKKVSLRGIVRWKLAKWKNNKEIMLWMKLEC